MTRRLSAPSSDLPPDWQAIYLAHLERGGGKYKAAQAAGVKWRDVRHARETSPEFAESADEALELYGDDLETRLVSGETKKWSTVGLIVRLKALRPDRYIEKHSGVNLTVNQNTLSVGGVTEADAVDLLRKMLANAGPETRRILAARASSGSPKPAAG